MTRALKGPRLLRTAIEHWPLRTSVQITGYRWDSSDVLFVGLEQDGYVGRGEAAGVYYRDETPESMLEQIESIRGAVEAGMDRGLLQQMLPLGGARNALDCALWDLEAKFARRSVWDLAEVGSRRPLLTMFTCSADTPEAMATAALSYRGARSIKLKLTGEAQDAERVRAVRKARPDVWLGVDANQGFTLERLDALMPLFQEAGVALIEQPLPIGQEGLLDRFRSPIPLAADESVQGVADIVALVGRFQVVNIKLDKSGGLTEGLAMARAARALGLACMVGNMSGTSLAMAPAAVLGQLCKFVDLDGPVFLREDRATPVEYLDGRISCPEKLWGHPEVSREGS